MQSGNNFTLYGQILWLWSNSSLHSSWPLASAAGYIIPAIENKQFMLLIDSKQMPRAYVSWALLSERAQAKYLANPNSLEPADWHSGDRLWFIDFIAPFGFKDVIALRRKMSELHGGKYFARSIRLRAGQKARVIEYHAGSSDLERTQELKEQYYAEVLKHLNALNQSQS